jgi:hypothetical protein
VLPRADGTHDDCPAVIVADQAAGLFAEYTRESRMRCV